MNNAYNQAKSKGVLPNITNFGPRGFPNTSGKLRTEESPTRLQRPRRIPPLDRTEQLDLRRSLPTVLQSTEFIPERLPSLSRQHPLENFRHFPQGLGHSHFHSRPIDLSPVLTPAYNYSSHSTVPQLVYTPAPYQYPSFPFYQQAPPPNHSRVYSEKFEKRKRREESARFELLIDELKKQKQQITKLTKKLEKTKNGKNEREDEESAFRRFEKEYFKRENQGELTEKMMKMQDKIDMMAQMMQFQALFLNNGSQKGKTGLSAAEVLGIQMGLPIITTKQS